MGNKPGITTNKNDPLTTEIAANIAQDMQVGDQVMDTVTAEENKNLQAALRAQDERDDNKDPSNEGPNDDNIVAMGLTPGVKTLSAVSSLQGKTVEELVELLEDQTNDLQQNLDTLVNWAKANPGEKIALASLPERERRIITAFCTVDEDGKVASEQILNIEGINFSKDSNVNRTCTHTNLAQTITGIMKLEHKSISYQFEEDPSTHLECINAIESAINTYQPDNHDYDPTFYLSRKNNDGELQRYEFKRSEANTPNGVFQALKQEIISANQGLVTSNNDDPEKKQGQEVTPVPPTEPKSENKTVSPAKGGLTNPSPVTATEALKTAQQKSPTASEVNKQKSPTVTQGDVNSPNQSTSTPSPSPPTL